MKAFVLTAAIAVCVIPARVEGRVWTVGRANADFPLIAPAIAAAADGDEIRIGEGVYREDLVLGRRVSLVGDGRAILFGTGAGTVIDVMADGCEIRDLIIDGTGIGDANQMDAAIRLSSNRNVVRHNVMRRVFYGVVIAGGSQNVVSDNTIEGLLHLPFGRRGDGVYVYKGPANQILRNRIVGQRDAIFLQYAHKVRVEGNVVEQSRYGLHDMFADDTVVVDNVFRGSLVGANLMNSRRLTLERNQFMHNRGITAVGLSLKDCDGSTVSDNRFSGNARGLQLDGASANMFLRNHFSQNDVAVRLLASAERNVFSENVFLQNWSDVVESGVDTTTAWSSGSLGNRWSRYSGFDFDGNGVGDAPHPLLRPFEQIEAANELARLYLQSPAAGALDLAARGAAQARASAVDPHPLTGKTSGRAVEGPGKAGPYVLVPVAGVFIFLIVPIARRGRARAR